MKMIKCNECGILLFPSDIITTGTEIVCPNCGKSIAMPPHIENIEPIIDGVDDGIEWPT